MTKVDMVTLRYPVYSKDGSTYGMWAWITVPANSYTARALAQWNRK